MDLRIEQLRRFAVLADELNFTAAAARLHVAQQVLSAQIKQLETGLGVTLFTRTTRRVDLTAAGRAFLERARAAIDEADAAVRVARRAADRERILLACEIDAQWALTERLTGLAAVDPTVEVVPVYILDVSTLRELVPARIDAVALWGRPPPWLTGGPAVVALEDVHVVLAEGDPLAGRDRLGAPDLADRTLWMWSRGTGTQSWETLVAHVGAGPGRIRVVGDEVVAPAQERMIDAVRVHGGYTFAPARYLAQVRPAGVRAVPLTPALRVPVHLCWAGEPSAGLRRFVRRLSEIGPTHDPAR